jgi:hypothetical protein
MVSSTTVTKRPKGRRWLQPLKPAASHAATLSDAEVVVRWLNDAPRASRDRVLGIYRSLESLHPGLSALQELEREADERIRAMKVPKPDAASAAFDAKYRHQYRTVEKQFSAINKTLASYSFHPGVGHIIISDMKGAGLVTNANKRTFRLPVGEWQLVEADAALALVRLYLIGELHKVHLCAKCGLRWHVAAKSHYRFCSAECRETYYTEAPDYQAQRKKIQQDYRDRQKRNKAAGAASTIARKGKGEHHV